MADSGTFFKCPYCSKPLQIKVDVEIAGTAARIDVEPKANGIDTAAREILDFIRYYSRAGGNFEHPAHSGLAVFCDIIKQHCVSK